MAKKKRKLSRKQLAALARGRAKAKRNRRGKRRRNPSDSDNLFTAARRARRAAKKRTKKNAKRRRHAPGCRCGAPGCCTASWRRCRCKRCRGSGHAQRTKTPLRNPPRRSTARKPGRVRIHVDRFPGTPVALEYRREGKVWRHRIKGGRIGQIRGTSAIVITGVRVRPFLEG